MRSSLYSHRLESVRGKRRGEKYRIRVDRLSAYTAPRCLRTADTEGFAGHGDRGDEESVACERRHSECGDANADLIDVVQGN